MEGTNFNFNLIILEREEFQFGTPLIFWNIEKLKKIPLTHYRVSGILSVAIYSPYTCLEHTDAPYDT